MLSEEDEFRLDLLTSIIRKEDWHDLNTDSFLWLALKLKEANDELKRINELKETINSFSKSEQPTTLTVQYKGTTRIVATLENNKYTCIWCEVWFLNILSAKSHGLRHLRVKDPE